MTIRIKLETALVNHGLWPEEATTVIQTLESDENFQMMKGRYDEDETAYPPALFATILFVAKNKAVEWIDTNNPKHFARALLSA